MREWVEPLRAQYPSVQVAFIFGNHDADSYEHWERLHDTGSAIALHGQVLDLDGVRVAGLGGNFMGRVWMPPDQPKFTNKEAAALNRGAFQWRGGQRPAPGYLAAIYPDEFEALAAARGRRPGDARGAQLPSHGFEALDELARAMRVVRSLPRPPP